MNIGTADVQADVFQITKTIGYEHRDRSISLSFGDGTTQSAELKENNAAMQTFALNPDECGKQVGLRLQQCGEDRIWQRNVTV